MIIGNIDMLGEISLDTITFSIFFFVTCVELKLKETTGICNVKTTDTIYIHLGTKKHASITNGPWQSSISSMIFVPPDVSTRDF